MADLDQLRPTADPGERDDGRPARPAGCAADIGVRRVDGRAELDDLIGEALSTARREVCSTLPVGGDAVALLRKSWDHDLDLVSRGLLCHVLCPAEAIRGPKMLVYLDDVAAAGVDVRVRHRVGYRTLIVDRRTAFVAPDPDSLRPCLVIREPALVDGLSEQFLTHWRSACSVGSARPDDVDDRVIREVLELLRTGATDEVAARQLGVSTRTIRRRVAAVLDVLGASSRFEAGVKAAQTGWL